MLDGLLIRYYAINLKDLGLGVSRLSVSTLCELLRTDLRLIVLDLRITLLCLRLIILGVEVERNDRLSLTLLILLLRDRLDLCEI